MNNNRLSQSPVHILTTLVAVDWENVNVVSMMKDSSILGTLQPLRLIERGNQLSIQGFLYTVAAE